MGAVQLAQPACCRCPWAGSASSASGDEAAHPAAFLAQARLSLRLPWWSFADGFAAMRDTAEMSGGVAAIRQAMEEQDEMSNMPGMKTVIKTGACRL